MDRTDSGLPSIGIIGGGQLAKMMAQDARRMGFRVSILDPQRDPPAARLADRVVRGSFKDTDALRALSAGCDVVTYDIEHIDTGALAELAREGVRLFPSPRVLAVIQDKLEQKRLLAARGIPVARFAPADPREPETLRQLGLPAVQKLRFGGYDGRGVRILATEQDLDRALPGPSLVEEKLDLDLEIAFLVARDRSGSVAAYPPVEMRFEPAANVLDMLLAPARVEPRIERIGRDLAVSTVEALDGVGLFGIEMFLTTSGALLVNEIAPRPHNSGHHTIEACSTSQFEQHLRAITGLPLGSTEQWAAAALVNLLGHAGGRGPAVVEGVAEAAEVQGASIHIYGKTESWPGRKMGHITVLHRDIEEAARHAVEARRRLRIGAREE